MATVLFDVHGGENEMIGNISVPSKGEEVILRNVRYKVVSVTHYPLGDSKHPIPFVFVALYINQ